MIPNKPNEIFPYICHFIFAIILATSYEPLAEVFTASYEPIIRVLSNPELIPEHHNAITQGTELILAYIAIISGWIGYTRSVMRWPHTNTKRGIIRFSVDLAILFCFFGLLVLASSHDEHGDRFVQLIIILFIVFAISDIIKISEYHKKTKVANNDLFKSIIITNGNLLALMVIYTVYYMAHKYAPELIDDWTYLLLLFTNMALLLIFRIQKWERRLAHSQRMGRS